VDFIKQFRPKFRKIFQPLKFVKISTLNSVMNLSRYYA
jgi:hypothetical protein